MSARTPREDSPVAAGAAAVAPLVVGIIPFGLVAGSVPVARGLGGLTAVVFSLGIFAGSSQIAAIDGLTEGAGLAVTIVTAIAINLRMLLYSASIAPRVSDVPLRRRLLMGYVLTDQAYAVSITRWDQRNDSAADRFRFYMAAAVTLWASWQAATLVGVMIGGSLPEALHVEFAIPLTFLVLLIPAVTSSAAVAAAVAGGAGAVGVTALGGRSFSVIAGGLIGVIAGTIVAARTDDGGP